MIYLYAITWVPIWNPDLVSTPLIIQSLITDADKVRENILNIPFSYMEMRTEDNDYYAMFLVPSMNLYQTLRYLGETVKLESLDFPSMEYAGKFAPHYNLYEDNKGWLNPFKRGLEKILEKVTPFKEGGY